MNISSIVIKTLPHNVTMLLAIIEESDLCELHFHDDKVRIIVTIEGENSEEEMNKFRQIQDLPYVVTADMAYNYVGDEGEGLTAD